MKKASFIKPEDLQQLEFDEQGNIIIPEGYEIYIKEDPGVKRLERIAELESVIGTKPTDKELIEAGKLYHPYYMMLWELQQLQQEQFKGVKGGQ